MWHMWYWVRRVAGLIFPVFAKAADFRGLGGLKWVLHVVLLAVILGVLWFLNRVFQIRTYVRADSQFLRDFFLPVLFLLVYALCWFIWWVWKLLGPEEDTSDFPDIDAAWAEGVEALAAGGVNLADAPLFLVVGTPASGPDGLFHAPGIPLPVRPRSLNAPVQVWGGPDAVFVTAPGASIGGEYAKRLAGPPPDAPAPATASIGLGEANMATLGVKSIGVGDARGDIKAIMDRAHREGRELTEAEKTQLRLMALPRAQPTARVAGRTLLQSEDANFHAARLWHLCRLIARDRDPFCPANGVLVLIPWAATEAPETADEAALVVQRDLATARDGFQLFCPVVAMFCDLEQARGFREFRSGFPADQLRRRLGQRLPLAPDAPPEALPAVFEAGAKWIGQSVFPVWIHKMLKVEPEPDGPRTEAEVDAANRSLHALLREVRLRYPRLGRILSHGVGGALIHPGGEFAPLFGGCYIAGTGKAADEQAFVPGVLQRLIENQSYVSWTPDVFADDDWYRRTTQMGYIALAVFVLLVLGTGVWWFGIHK